MAARLGVTPERLQAAIERGRAILFAAREERIQPGRDEKVLTAWNGMMLRAFAEAGAALERQDWIEVAVAERRVRAARAAGRTAGCCGPGRTAGRS